MSIVRFRDVKKSFSDTPVLKDLSFDLEPAKIYCLLGESGSGKTTALRLINRMLDPDAGSITVFNKDINSWNPIELRRQLGYAIQGSGLFPHMTAFENISLIAKRIGWSSSQMKERAEELMSLLNLDPTDYLPRRPREMSGGQQQRLGIARALFLRPELLLMDEPFGALDPLTREDIQDEFMKLQKEFGFTAIIVTHDLHEAFKMSDKVLLLRHGQLDQFGPPSELIQSPKSDYVANLVGRFQRSLQVNYV